MTNLINRLTELKRLQEQQSHRTKRVDEITIVGVDPLTREETAWFTIKVDR
ncbi:MAG: hypothetical protein F6K00_31615 [Leptolyngbya sp. SIOISBB]|nr:hypothetical protein [Leptolyngbya sp. SIOISBB]